MHIIRYKDLPAAPWINGGGTVKVIGSGLMVKDDAVSFQAGDNWDWRLSLADVGQPGEFSRLPGIRRILTVVDGGPLHLTINGKPRQAAHYRPVAFDGGTPTMAELPRGPVKNLNLMCRRGRAGGSMSIIPLKEHLLLLNQAAVLLDGDAQANGRKLNMLDTVFCSNAETTAIKGHGTLALVGLYRASSR